MGVISGPGCRDGFCVRHVIVERDQRQPVVCHKAQVTDDPEDTAINIVSVLAILWDKGTICDYLHVKNMEFDDVDNSEGDDKADTDRNKGYCRQQKGFLLRHFSKDGADRDGEHGDVDNCCNNW